MSETAAPTVEVLDDQPVIPAERTPKCTREFFLRPPDWRYQAAMRYLEDEKHHITPTIPTDPYVQYAIRILRAYKHKGSRVFLETMAPDAVSVISLGVYDRHSAIAADIESCLIQGYTTVSAVYHGFYVKPAVFDLYGKIFFDLTGIQAVHSWINDFLIEPERHNENTMLLRARILAYYGGQQMAGSAVTPGKIDEEAQEMMKKIANNEQLKRIFDYIVRKTDMNKEEYVTIMESAVKSMTEKDFQEHMRDRDEAGSSSLNEMAEHLEEGIRAYSQKELESFNENGLDFVNQYTPVIIRKETTDDGK